MDYSRLEDFCYLDLKYYVCNKINITTGTKISIYNMIIISYVIVICILFTLFLHFQVSIIQTQVIVLVYFDLFS